MVIRPPAVLGPNCVDVHVRAPPVTSRESARVLGHLLMCSEPLGPPGPPVRFGVTVTAPFVFVVVALFVVVVVVVLSVTIAVILVVRSLSSSSSLASS